MDFNEICRRWKRVLENFRYRKLFIIIIVVVCFLFYFGPGIFSWIFRKDATEQNLSQLALERELETLYTEANDFDANIQHLPMRGDEYPFRHIIGNGLIGIVIERSSQLYIRSSRKTLSLSLQYHPVITFNYHLDSETATAINFVNGVGYIYQCYVNGVCLKYQYYAHRRLPNILVQEVEVINPTLNVISLELNQLKTSYWKSSHTIRLKAPEGRLKRTLEFEVMTGIVNDPYLNEYTSVNSVAVCIISEKLDSVFNAPNGKSSMQILTSVCYSEAIKEDEYENEKRNAEDTCIKKIKEALLKNPSELKDEHISVWMQLWSTGISISFSKAADALNGNQINATIYYVLSNVRSYYYEDATTSAMKTELSRKLYYADGCYGGYHHTLRAINLWGDLTTVENVNTVVLYWLLTLEKQGCYKLVSAGASGVMQAMILSFGGFRFSNQHLEFNMHPKFFHRDFNFRRINYGNATHLNISVELQHDNKAVISVALDRSERNYYACDGGCLDEPVQLGPEKITFPVKLTEPVTSVLYITSDKQHMELLKHTIHVTEVVEAPAQEHNVVALHRHGHHLGGLPTLFWFPVCFLIIVFHLFLCKLIYNEYCGSSEKYRSYRYRKL